MRRILLGVVMSVVVTLSPPAAAIGLGEITVYTRLNQPLRAEIPLLFVTPEDMESIRAGLASADDFERRGIQRPDILRSLRFRLVSDGERPATAVEVTSTEAIREPALQFMLEIGTRNTRLVRGYVVLLDPPDYSVRVLPAATAPKIRIPTERSAAQRYGPVKPGESISVLGFRLRPDTDVTGVQMAWALYLANPQAFEDGNINHLRVGAHLTIPPKDMALEVAYPEALRRVRGEMPVAPTEHKPQSAEPIADIEPSAPIKKSASGDELQQHVPKAPSTPEVGKQTATEMQEAVQRYGPVKPGDTLWTLGFRLRPDSDVTRVQMTWALYEANPEAFLNGDINLLQAGVYLEVPPRHVVTRLSYQEAWSRLHPDARPPALTKEKKALNEPRPQPKYELKIAPAKEEGMAGPPHMPRAGTDTLAEEELSGYAETLQQALRDREGELEMLSLRVEEMEQTIADMQDLTEEGTGQVDDLEQSMNAQADIPPALADTENLARLEVIERTVAKLQAQLSQREEEFRRVEAALSESPETETAEWSGISETAQLVIEGILFLGTAGLIGWILALRARSRRERGTADDLRTVSSLLSSEAAATLEDAPMGPGSDVPSDSAHEPSPAPTTREDLLPQEVENAASEEVEEPLLSEAEVYLAYGQFEQAERLLWDLVEAEPNVPAYRVPLLRVLHAAGKRPPFLVHARELKRLVGDSESELWNEVAEMGRDLCPGDSLFATESSDESVEDALERTMMTGERALYPLTDEASSEASSPQSRASSISAEDLDFFIDDTGDVAREREHAEASSAKERESEDGAVPKREGPTKPAEPNEPPTNSSGYKQARDEGEFDIFDLDKTVHETDEAAEIIRALDAEDTSAYDISDFDVSLDETNLDLALDDGTAVPPGDKSEVRDPHSEGGGRLGDFERELSAWEDELLRSDDEPEDSDSAPSGGDAYTDTGPLDLSTSESSDSDDLEVLDLDLDTEINDEEETSPGQNIVRKKGPSSK